MSDYAVEPEALGRAADAVEAAAQGNDATAGSMTPPPPLMMGLFLSPLVATFGSAVHDHAQSLVKGVAHENRLVGEGLRVTGRNYRTAEDYAKDEAAKVGTDL